MLRYLRFAILPAMAVVFMGTYAEGQVRIGGGLGSSPLAGLDGDAVLGDPVTIRAEFAAATADRPAVLAITARMLPEWHVYSLTQPPGGPTKTRIEVSPSPEFELVGEFRAVQEPKSHVDQQAWIGLTLEEHYDEVTWFAPIQLAAGVDPASLEIKGKVRMLACKESCIPVNKEFVARLGDISGLGITAADIRHFAQQNPQSEMALFQVAGSEVTVSGRVVPGVASPNGRATLEIKLTPAEGWHVYAYAARDEGHGSKPTLIALESTSGLIVRRPTTDAPVTTDTSVPEFGVMRYHTGPVTWRVPVEVPEDAGAGEHTITGLIGYQACETREDGLGSCELPRGVQFHAKLRVSDTAVAAASPIEFTPATYKDAAIAAAAWSELLDETGGWARLPPSQETGNRIGSAEASSPQLTADRRFYDLSRIVIQEPGGSLAYYIALAFVGGIILNLMPCVLPVIGLKVMSFVQQAGQSRAHALALNAWFAAGIVSVFLLLGALAVWIGLSWGGQFGSTAFNATLAAIVFAMALSLLGVWEIPIPGFFGSGSVQTAAAKEGPLGAFLKGVVTTVLATPCTGPFMATAIAWAVTQSATTTLVVFASLGLGMASPYLLVGIFPDLLQFLPKPGAWMETFKQVCGWILVATVVFILTFIDAAAVVPTILLLVGVGMACWLVARTPLTAALNDQLQSWALAGAVLLLFGVASFGWLYPDVMRPRFAEIGSTAGARLTGGNLWQPFSLERLQQEAVEDGRTVMVDFSAEWCLTCKALEKTVLHTEPIERAIADANVVTMYGDFTDYPAEIERTLQALRSNGVPVIAIFPGDRPYEPIVFRGAYTKKGLLAALVEATGQATGAVSQAAVAEVPLSLPPFK